MPEDDQPLDEVGHEVRPLQPDRPRHPAGPRRRGRPRAPRTSPRRRWPPARRRPGPGGRRWRGRRRDGPGHRGRARRGRSSARPISPVRSSARRAWASLTAPATAGGHGRDQHVLVHGEAAEGSRGGRQPGHAERRRGPLRTPLAPRGGDVAARAPDPAPIGLADTDQHLGQGPLAAAGRRHHGHPLAGMEHQVEVAQRPAAHLLELDDGKVDDGVVLVDRWFGGGARARTISGARGLGWPAGGRRRRSA